MEPHGLLTPPPEIVGAISQLLSDNKIQNVVMTEYQNPAIYVQKAGALLLLNAGMVELYLIDEDFSSHEFVVSYELASEPSIAALIPDLRRHMHRYGWF